MNDEIASCLGLLILGQKEGIRRQAQLTAEPWDTENARIAGHLQKLRFREVGADKLTEPRPDFLARFNRLFERSELSEPSEQEIETCCIAHAC